MVVPRERKIGIGNADPPVPSLLSAGRPFSPTAVAGIIMLAKPTIIELEMDRLEDVLRRAEAALKEEDYALLKAVPASTQWDIVRALAEHVQPIFEELAEQAAQGDVLYNDDTTVKILALMGDRGQQAASERRGLFTSGVVSTREGRRIALFFSGRQHAGENLKDVLAERAADLAAPIQMCDALSRNMPAELRTIVANCLAHARRQFVEVVDRFPEECRHVLEALAVV